MISLKLLYTVVFAVGCASASASATTDTFTRADPDLVSGFMNIQRAIIHFDNVVNEIQLSSNSSAASEAVPGAYNALLQAIGKGQSLLEGIGPVTVEELEKINTILDQAFVYFYVLAQDFGKQKKLLDENLGASAIQEHILEWKLVADNFMKKALKIIPSEKHQEIEEYYVDKYIPAVNNIFDQLFMAFK